MIHNWRGQPGRDDARRWNGSPSIRPFRVVGGPDRADLGHGAAGARMSYNEEAELEPRSSSTSPRGELFSPSSSFTSRTHERSQPFGTA